MTNPPPLSPGAPITPPLFIAKLSNYRRVALWSIAVLFTLLAVHWSARNGRLAQDPTYDDVGYFVDATERLDVLDKNGLAGLLHNLVLLPLHSPYSTLLGMASFAMLGINDWAPYAFNVFGLAAFLLMCSRIFGDLSKLAFYSLVIYCLTIPFSLRAIHDFRPDFAAALATAVFTWFGLAAVTGKEEDETKNSVLSGLFFATALWIKPSVFAHSIAIAFVLGACIIAGFWLPGLRARNLRRGVLCALRFGGIGALLAAPYFWLNGAQILNYFEVNTQGSDAHIASFKGSPWGFLRAFVVDGVQTLTFGPHLWLMLACCIFALFWALRRRYFLVAYQIAGLLLTAMASVTIFVYGRHNNEYFGLPYQMLVTLAGLTSLAVVIRENRRATLVAPALVLIACTTPFFLPPGSFWTPAPEADPTYGWNRKLVEALTVDSQFPRSENRRASPVIPVYVGFAGSVNGNSMKWICIKERLPFVFSDLHRSGDFAAQLKLARDAAYAVVCTSAATSLYSALPSGGTYGDVLTALQRDPNFREVKITSDLLPAYRLFRNIPRANQYMARFSVAIGWPATGFLPPEGPYPEWELPTVRWSTYPESVVTVTVPAPEADVLRFSVSGPPGFIVRIKLDGVTINEHVQQTTSFEWSEIPLALHAGTNEVSLEYHSPTVQGDPGARALLFRDIEVDASSKYHDYK